MILKWPFIRPKFSKEFLQNCKKLKRKRIVFYVIAFDKTKI